MTIKYLLMSSNYFVLNKNLVKILGIETAFFLSVLVEADEMLADDDGWFYQTSPNIEEITGLSNHKQNKCIEQLISLGVLLQENKGMPMKRYFKLNYEKVLEILNTSIENISKQGFKNFKSKDSKNLKPCIEKISNNKEININNINKEHNINKDRLIDDSNNTNTDDNNKNQSINQDKLNPEAVKFRKNLDKFINLVEKSTGVNRFHVEQLIDLGQYKRIDFDELLRKIESSDFLMGKLSQKPRVNHFITEKMINRILVGFYVNYSSKKDLTYESNGKNEEEKKQNKEEELEKICD